MLGLDRPEPAPFSHPSRYAGTVEARTLTTSDGVTLAAAIRAATNPRAAVVVVHGFASSATHPDVVVLAGALHDHGFTVVTYDARGHGASEGECTLGDDERRDVDAAVAHARTVGAGLPVVVLGISMGAIAALRHACTDPSLAGVVTVSCPARWRLPRNARGVLGAWLTQTGVGRRTALRRMGVRVAEPRPRPVAPVELVRARHPPVAIVHGRGDPFIPATDADELFLAAREPRRIAVVPGAWHAYAADAVPVILDAVDWTLGAARPR